MLPFTSIRRFWALLCSCQVQKKKKSTSGLYKSREIALICVMRNNNPHYFAGRGKTCGNHPKSYRIIECRDGTVLAIIYICHGVGFISGYCRKAMIDPWGVYCHAPFQRASDATLTRAWAEPLKKDGIFLFRPTRLEIVTEQPWMMQQHR